MTDSNRNDQSTSSDVNSGAEPFPTLDSPPSLSSLPRPSSKDASPAQSRRGSETIGSRVRRASKSFAESNPPTGFCIATGQLASSVPSLSDIRKGSFGSDGWSVEGQVREKDRRASVGRRGSSQTGEQIPTRKASAGAIASKSPQSASGETQNGTLVEDTEGEQRKSLAQENPRTQQNGGAGILASKSGSKDIKMSENKNSSDTNLSPKITMVNDEFRTATFDNGYHFPPKRSWQESTVIFLKAAWKFVLTPIGFAVVLYGANVIAWGGMLFLLLCNASKYMCHPTCNDINSPRRIWIEIDCQIVNALFCVTGFGTIPWRFRDLYYLLQYRIQKKEIGLRRLAGINRGWFRLAGSQELPINLGPAEMKADGVDVPESCLAFPLSKTPNAPLTGVRAPPTPLWKLDFVVWSMVWNTFLQAVLSGLMWGMNRYNRPSWSTGLFVALACIVAGAGGVMTLVESKKVKGIEGIPLSEDDQERLRKDKELGIIHYNNINDEGPKEPKEKKPHFDRGIFKKNASSKTDEDTEVQESAVPDRSEQL